VSEHDRTIGRQGFAEPDPVGAVDQPRKRLAPLLERAIAEIVALEVEKIEGDE
jgi:hypothetical protein